MLGVQVAEVSRIVLEILFGSIPLNLVAPQTSAQLRKVWMIWLALCVCGFWPVLVIAVYVSLYMAINQLKYLIIII